MNLKDVFWMVSLVLIVMGFGTYIIMWILYYGLSAPSWSYNLGIYGLDFCFVGFVIYCVADFEKKPRRMFKEGVILLAADGLLYLMAGWTISGLPSLSNGQLGAAWSPINLEGAGIPGYYFLFLGILIAMLAGFGLMFFGGVLAFKRWIEKLAHVPEYKGDSLDRLAKLKTLLDSGAITKEEFEEQKKIILKKNEDK